MGDAVVNDRLERARAWRRSERRPCTATSSWDTGRAGGPRQDLFLVLAETKPQLRGEEMFTYLQRRRIISLYLHFLHISKL